MKSKRKVRKRIVLGAFAIILLYFIFGGDYNIYNLLQYHQKEKELNATIQNLEEESQALTVEIEMLKTDSTYIEKVAREKYHMARPGDVIFLTEQKTEKKDDK